MAVARARFDGVLVDGDFVERDVAVLADLVEFDDELVADLVGAGEVRGVDEPRDLRREVDEDAGSTERDRRERSAFFTHGFGSGGRATHDPPSEKDGNETLSEA